MKIGFPYMGCVTGYKKLLELLGHEVIMPEKPSQRTVNLGVLNSPEFICYPFKIILGTYIELCERGAEVIISSGGSGPCRAGMYCEIHKRVLKQLGFDTELIIFDSIFQDFGEFMRKLKMIKNGKSVFKIIGALRVAAHMICNMDKLEKEMKIKRAYEANKGDFDKAWEKICELYDKCNNVREVKLANKKAREILDGVETRSVSEEKKLRIGVVGEIYVIMESSVNMEIEKRLNGLGAEAVNVQYISDWVKHNLIPRRINRSKSWKMVDKGKDYMRYACGGHALENTGWISEFAEEGFDGIVHLMPFGCLPELVTRSMLPQISEDYDLPVLSVSLDEQMGEANLQTRVEAFIDLCRSKKNAKNADEEKDAAPKKSGKEAARV